MDESECHFSGQQSVSSNSFRLFPSQEVLQEGSSVFFCCIPPDGARVTALHFSNTPYPLINISRRVRAIRVLTLNTTKIGVNLICQDDSGKKQAVLNYVTCEFRRKQEMILFLFHLIISYYCKYSSVMVNRKNLKCQNIASSFHRI